jgi:hypothetical protein
MMDGADFYMDSQVVGAFPGGELPTVDGSYRYEPYRSPEHVNLHRQLQAGKAPRCGLEFCPRIRCRDLSKARIVLRAPFVLAPSFAPSFIQGCWIYKGVQCKASLSVPDVLSPQSRH